MKKTTEERVLRSIRAFLIRIILACLLFLAVLALAYFEGEIFGINAYSVFEMLKNSWI